MLGGDFGTTKDIAIVSASITGEKYLDKFTLLWSREDGISIESTDRRSRAPNSRAFLLFRHHNKVHSIYICKYSFEQTTVKFILIIF